MIAKHIPIRSLKKSDFANLVNYITDSKNNIERVGNISFNNCNSSKLDIAITEILATQQMNTRAKSDKTYHLIVSFRQGENPSEDILKDVEENICNELGFSQHQRVSVVHYDTDNVHMHIAINKIHPEKLTMHEPFQSYKKLSDTCKLLEIKHGLEVDNHLVNQLSSVSKSNDMERHSGIESLVSWVNRVCLDDIKSASNWEELHQVMAWNGLSLHKKGNGFVVESIESGVFTKASTIDRSLSKANLENRIGSFEKSGFEEKAVRGYSKKPKKINVDTNDLYKNYLDEQSSKKEKKHIASESSRSSKQFEIESVKRSNKLKRLIISNSKNHLMRKILYKQASKSLKDNLDRINEKYKSKSKEINQNNLRLTWVDWLKAQAEKGNNDALNALRVRKNSPLKGNTFSGSEKSPVNKPRHNRVVTKGGVITHQKGEYAGIRDDGHQIKIARDISASGVINALKLAQSKYEGAITINGSESFKYLVVKAAVVGNVDIIFADKQLEQQKINLQMEKQNESIRRRINSNGNVRNGIRTTNRDLDRSRHGSNASRPEQKSDIGGIRSRAPTTGINSLRHLSSVNVASIVNSGSMLLSGHASDNLDKQKSRRTTNSLRWGVFGSRLTLDQITAAESYISERIEKRLKGINIPDHKPLSTPIKAEFVGARNVKGQPLVLLKGADNSILVLPVIGAVKHFKIGEVVSVSQTGSVNRARKVKR
ncbi:TraI/MobA(P) family conjugative relaxase [Shewanella frigidimarina]|uniref:TraI/MobA(P) family conjugative relaxase n=1 Tax=Shewanella frigidimarina TaxID=56812 RepID=UPI003D78D65B